MFMVIVMVRDSAYLMLVGNDTVTRALSSILSPSQNRSTKETVSVHSWNTSKITD